VASTKLSFLVFATEWFSRHGGLSTFNRELCTALARVGHRVVCAVPEADVVEAQNALAAQVELISCTSTTPAVDLNTALFRRLKLPDAFNPTVLIGHARITGPAAKAQLEDHFPNAARVHFIHVAPGEIEWFKGRDGATERAEQREQEEIILCNSASLVVAVGPRLHRVASTFVSNLAGTPSVYRLDPGMSAQSLNRNPIPPEIECLLIGRAEEIELKGLDIAACALADSHTWSLQAQPSLIVRGVPAGKGDSLRKLLLEIAGTQQLDVRPREYSADVSKLESDLRRASVVLMPSRKEGFGLVGLEAIAAGRPVLISKQSGLGLLLTERLEEADVANIVVEVTGDRMIDAAVWADELRRTLRDREAAFARAHRIRDLLSAPLSWDLVVREFVTRLEESIAVRTETRTQRQESANCRVASAADYDLNKPVFNVPYKPKGNHVIGRTGAVGLVRQYLTGAGWTAIGQTAAIQGLGGLGKTQLAVEYAYEYRNSYANGVVWLHANQDIDAQLTRLAVEAKWVAPVSNHQEKLDIALHRLRTYSDCLVIFDGVEQRDSLTAYLPNQSATPHLLITSREPQAGFVPIGLEPLSTDQSLELLTQEAGRAPVTDVDCKAAIDIVRRLDGLPLAIEIAGAFLRYRPAISFANYFGLLSRSPQEALAGKHFSSFTLHHADLEATLQVSDQVLRDEPLLREILALLTWSASAPMGMSLLSALLAVEANALPAAISLGQTLKVLVMETHPSDTSDETGYRLHRLVTDVLQRQYPIDGNDGRV